MTAVQFFEHIMNRLYCSDRHGRVLLLRCSLGCGSVMATERDIFSVVPGFSSQPSLGKGALQVQNIDMDLTDKDIDIKLGETLHHPCETTQTNGEDLPNIHDSPCHHFICKKNCHYPRMEQLVRDLCWRLEEHEVKPGSLLLFTVADSSYPLILGVSMKRPITHIFLNASLDAEQVSFTDSTGALPQFQSSHQLMLTLLRKHSPDPDDILVMSVDAWHCRGFLETSGDATILKSNPDTLLCEFKITSERKAKKKPAIVILPLGFENRLKSMRAQARKKGGQASRKVQKKTKVKNTNPKQKATSSSGSSSDSEGNASGSNQTCGDREEEEAAPMSTVVAREEQAVEEVADEVVSVDLQRHEKAEVIKANTSTARSFFAKELGLDSAGTATPGRSICLCCRTKINIHTVRYCWYFSKVKPSGWCHSHCLQIQIRQTGLREQAIQKLKEVATQAESTPHLYNPVAADARKHLQTLQSDAA